MKPESVKHSIILIFSIVAIWFWTSTPSLNVYNLQLTGVFVLLYFVSKLFLRSQSRDYIDLAPTVILSSICLLLVFSTGGASSPLFFLLDFLLFAIALLFEPSQAAVASVVLASLFLWQNQTDLTTDKIVNLASLLFMTPIAILFSRNYLDNLRAQGRIAFLESALKEEEADSLLWISTQAKPSIASVLNATTDIVIYFNAKSKELLLPKALHDKLKAIQDDLITLYGSASSLEETISESSDSISISDDK